MHAFHDTAADGASPENRHVDLTHKGRGGCRDDAPPDKRKIQLL
jgi:hypothetical protein